MNVPGPSPLALRAAWSEILVDPARALAFEARLAGYVAERRWFRGKSRAIARAALVDRVGLPLGDGDDSVVGIVRVHYRDGGTEDYVLPLVACRGAEAEWARGHAPHLVVCTCVFDDGTGCLICDALGVARFQRRLFACFEREAVVGDRTAIRFRRVAGPLSAGGLEPRSMTGEQSNTSVVFGDRFILKVTRRLEPGVSADLEMGEFLTRVGYRHAPAVVAAAEIGPSGAPAATIAIVHAFAPNRGDAWTVFLDIARRALSSDGGSRDASDGGWHGSDAGSGGASDGASRGAWLDEPARLVRRLAQRVGELHLALAGGADRVEFRPEVISHGERLGLVERVRDSLASVLDALAMRREALPSDARRAAIDAVARRGELDERLRAFVALGAPIVKTRIHGDLHLGQVLFTGDDFLLIDFEGEPARTLAERKAKRSPLADVAGMLRSMHYASAAAARSSSDPDAGRRAAAWQSEAAAAFLDAYFATARAAAFVPSGAAERATVLDFYVLEKCVYEIQYELDNRPDWVALPVLGLLERFS